MYKTPAHEICDNLGFTPEEAQMSAEAVASRIDRVDNWEKVTTTAVLAGGIRVHLHQLASDSDGDKWIILGINGETIEMTRLVPSLDGPAFMENQTVSHGQFVMKYTPETRSMSNSEWDKSYEEPVWGY